MKIEILHESTPLLAEWVGSNLLDIAFITTPFDENTRKHNYHKKVLHRFSDTIIAGQAFSKLKGRVMTLGEIMEYHLICTKKGSETYTFYQHLFAQSGLEFKPTVETADTGQVLEYAAENLGIGVIHPDDAAKALREGRIFEITPSVKLHSRYIAFLCTPREKPVLLQFEHILYELLNLPR